MYATLVVVAVMVVAGMSWTSWVGMGLGPCGGSGGTPNLPEHSRATVICELEFGEGVIHAGGARGVYEYLTLCFPIIVFLAGLGAAWVRRSRRVVGIAFAVAVGIILVPWTALLAFSVWGSAPG